MMNKLKKKTVSVDTVIKFLDVSIIVLWLIEIILSVKSSVDK